MLIHIAGNLAPKADAKYLKKLAAEMRCGSGPACIDRCQDYFERLDEAEEEYFAADAGSGGADRKDEGVRLSTVHSAKGLEFKVVFIVGLNSRW